MEHKNLEKKENDKRQNFSFFSILSLTALTLPQGFWGMEVPFWKKSTRMCFISFTTYASMGHYRLHKKEKIEIQTPDILDQISFVGVQLVILIYRALLPLN